MGPKALGAGGGGGGCKAQGCQGQGSSQREREECPAQPAHASTPQLCLSPISAVARVLCPARQSLKVNTGVTD